MTTDRDAADRGAVSWPGRAAARLVERLIERSLRRDFRRVVWIGDRPWQRGALDAETLDPARPLVLYTNHHSFHDGYLLWLLARRHLHRAPLLWMNEWERAPLFGPLGALPFPRGETSDARAQRLATIRETVRRLRQPGRVFLYFPEGVLGPPDAGIAPFPEDAFTRLARLFPPAAQWWPVGLRLTWWGEDRPTALLGGAAFHDAPTGDEHDRLEAAVDRLKRARPGDGTTLLDGRPSPHERWDLSRLAPLFRRWT